LPRYSVCMTCFNEIPTVRESMQSLLGQLDDDYEVVVVDNFSTDGTYEALLELSKSHPVRVVRSRCTRGKGRQIAFENSSGEVVIANLDLDDVFLPVIKDLVAGYHRITEGMVLAAFNSPPGRGGAAGWSQNMTVGPRGVLASIGGWRDLNTYEDWDVWSRAERAGSYRWTAFRFTVNDANFAEPEGSLSRLSRRYRRYRDRLRLGMRVFTPGEKVGTSQRLAYAAARLASSFQAPLSGQDPAFDSFGDAFYVDLGVGGKA